MWEPRKDAFVTSETQTKTETETLKTESIQLSYLQKMQLNELLNTLQYYNTTHSAANNVSNMQLEQFIRNRSLLTSPWQFTNTGHLHGAATAATAAAAGTGDGNTSSLPFLTRSNSLQTAATPINAITPTPLTTTPQIFLPPNTHTMNNLLHAVSTITPTAAVPKMSQMSQTAKTPAVSATTPMTPFSFDVLPINLLTDIFLRLNAYRIKNASTDLPQTTTNGAMTTSFCAQPTFSLSSAMHTIPIVPTATVASAAAAAPAVALTAVSGAATTSTQSTAQEQVYNILAVPAVSMSGGYVDSNVDVDVDVDVHVDMDMDDDVNTAASDRLLCNVRQHNVVTTKNEFVLPPPLHNSKVSSSVFKRNLRKRAQRAEIYSQSAFQTQNACEEHENDINLLPPPKKKWIRHYLQEDAIPSNVSITENSSPNSKPISTLLPLQLSNLHEQQNQQQQIIEQQQTTKSHTQHQQQQQQQSISNVAVIGNAAASKQMLLNGGIRIASAAATIGGTSKAINIPTQNNNNNNPSLPIYNVPRHKSSLPLTPPPMSTRKLIDRHSRIRSYSLSSNKISANQLLLHNGNSNSNHMIVDDAHMGYVSNSVNSSNSNHSPPRQANGGNHYMQIMPTGQQGSQLTHVTPSIGSGSGRRRTISSNSNGPGTREVHNKLEKHRRAQLKECYEALKNELPLRDEDRKKTSNLAILSESIRFVKELKDRDENLETEVEQLAKKKIMLQKKIVSLKRELGPKFEQLSGIIPDIELAGIPSERDNLNDSNSLSSGRGSILYSSSSSLSSGGSNNTMSSPIGAGLQTAMPTAISPVITKNHSNSTNSSTTSPVSPNMLQHYVKTNGAAQYNISPTGSPTSVLNGIVNMNSMPLSLTATALTRGSPTPSTPSPSPSSSSGVSSSSSLISSSPPMNGVISSRNKAVNIPNSGAIGNGTTIIATSAPGSVGIVNNNNANQAVNQNQNQADIKSLVISTAPTNINNGYRSNRGRKTSLSIGDGLKSNKTNSIRNASKSNRTTYDDGEKSAKYVKVYNGLQSTENARTTTINDDSSKNANNQMKCAVNNIATVSQQQLSQVVSGGSLVVNHAYTNGRSTNDNSIITANDHINRLPGGAELNILATSNNNNNNINIASSANGFKTSGAPATAFYHANGKLTFVNGGAAAGSNNGILIKDNTIVSVTTPSAATSLPIGTPLILATSPAHINGVNYGGNFAQLIAATSIVGGTALTHAQTEVAVNGSSPPKENMNNKSFSWRAGTTTN
ncbi:putative uncharacterized protein DDB_G0282133 isoform X2 [Teleopsis dalmanni]|uniref:putative uncharacterized protein DDB_G0282133 isoform X2 n=1 Tax=Teleopsis dalmanni TaxID=139649 RepID=UPI0018CD41A2|nr:putative uncharacterized protein DDB_G0282133 isoform X2 [Teleopsis dalmanni]